MTAPVVLRIDGPVTGKGRPKFARHGDRVVTRTPAKTKIAENRIYLAWQDSGSPRLPDGPVSLRLIVALRRPQGHWRRDGSLSAAGERAPWPTKKPDLDNVLKLVADALNGCAFHDDAQIVVAGMFKRWANPGEEEHTLVELRPVIGHTVEAAA